MNDKLLVTRPKHDITTHYLFYWAGKVIELAERKSVRVIDLKKERANKKEVASVLAKRNPRLVFLNGHGDNQCVMGHANEVLLEAGDNEKLTKTKIIYALSCRSGKVLGPASIKAGASAYLGYDNDFIFLLNEDKTGRPLNDETAKLFLDASNQIIIGLLKGHSVEEAHKRSKSLFRKNISKVASSESATSYLIPCLLWDINHQVCLGNKKAAFC